MAGDKAAVAKMEEVERSIVLKAKESSTKSGESCTASFETPRASSVSASKGNPREWPTPKPRKYVSPMAQAREEKKRRETAASATTKSKDWQNLSDMETSSTPPSSGSEHSDMSTSNKPGPDVPKFGEWENHSVNSGPCYTLLFQNAGQEKKAGNLVRVKKSDSAPTTEDLYKAPDSVSMAKKKKPSILLCCFTS